MCCTGVLDLKQAQEWVVTTKLGSSDKRPGTSATTPAPVLRFYASEMLMSTFVLTAAFYGIFSVNKWSFSIFLTLQGMAFISLASIIYMIPLRNVYCGYSLTHVMRRCAFKSLPAPVHNH